MRAVNLSPVDHLSFPTVTMIDTIGGDIKMDQEEFWKCVEYSLVRFHRDIEEKRKTRK